MNELSNQLAVFLPLSEWIKFAASWVLSFAIGSLIGLAIATQFCSC